MDVTEMVRRHRALAAELDHQDKHFNMADWIIIPPEEEEGRRQIISTITQLPEVVETSSLEEFIDVTSCSLPISCGTTACVAGWAVILWPDKIAEAQRTLDSDERDDIEYVAAALLGYGEDYNLAGLFESRAPWQEAHEAAAELRRRADIIERGYFDLGD